MNNRERILQALRANAAPFEDAPPRPAHYIPVMRPVEGDLLALFTAQLAERAATVHVAPDAPSAIRMVLDLVGSDKAVLAWESLPLVGLAEALMARQINVIIPHTSHEQRSDAMLEAEPIRVGITGADAGIAATGTLALVTGKGQGRLPSLLPPVHIALLRRDRLFPRLEDWANAEGVAALKQSRSVVFATGPSSSGDIEQINIRGVHGPGDVHIIVF